MGVVSTKRPPSRDIIPGSPHLSPFSSLTVFVCCVEESPGYLKNLHFLCHVIFGSIHFNCVHSHAVIISFFHSYSSMSTRISWGCSSAYLQTHSSKPIPPLLKYCIDRCMTSAPVATAPRQLTQPLPVHNHQQFMVCGVDIILSTLVAGHVEKPE